MQLLSFVIVFVPVGLVAYGAVSSLRAGHWEVAFPAALTAIAFALGYGLAGRQAWLPCVVPPFYLLLGFAFYSLRLMVDDAFFEQQVTPAEWREAVERARRWTRRRK